MEDDRTADEPRLLMALPGRGDDAYATFHRHLIALLRLFGEEAPPAGARDWEWAAREVVARHLADAEALPESVFDQLITTAVHDPDPSFNRQFVEPALKRFGRRRVRTVLLDLLLDGTNEEKTGAVSAWYWTSLPLRFGGGTAPVMEDETEDLRTRWREAALREFVANEHLDLRRTILPQLPLDPARYPAEFAETVATAIRIARAHPDEYIRHRVEHQVPRPGR